MKKFRLIALSAVLLLAVASAAPAIYVSNCPQICTPTCPCSIQCQGPFGPTTCGAAGEACVPGVGDEIVDDVLFLAFGDVLAELVTPSPSEETAPEAVEAEEETEE